MNTNFDRGRAGIDEAEVLRGNVACKEQKGLYENLSDQLGSFHVWKCFKFTACVEPRYQPSREFLPSSASTTSSPTLASNTSRDRIAFFFFAR